MPDSKSLSGGIWGSTFRFGRPRKDWARALEPPLFLKSKQLPLFGPVDRDFECEAH